MDRKGPDRTGRSTPPAGWAGAPGRGGTRAGTRPRRLAGAVLLLPAALLLSRCGTTGGNGAAPGGSALAECRSAVMVAALQRSYGPRVRILYNGHLACAGNLAEISVMIANLESARPGYTGPVGSPHGALMEYSHGAWHEVDLSRPNPYCTPDGRQTTAVPKALGTVCGIQ